MYLLSIIVFGTIGAVYTFTPYKTIKKIGIGFGLRHNDHVMISTVSLIIAVVSLYAIIRARRKS